MSNSIRIFDTTLRDGLSSDVFALSIEERIEIATQLELAGVSAIEAGYSLGGNKDLAALQSIARRVQRATVCGLASANPEDIDAVGTALQQAPYGRINTYASTRLKDPPRESDRLFSIIRTSVSHARNLLEDVQWTAMEATRSDFEILCRAVDVAIQAGASTVSLADTAGVATPDEFEVLVCELRKRVSDIDRITLSVHCHNDRELAVENSIAAVRAGVLQVEVTVNGIGPQGGNADWGAMVSQLDGEANLSPALNELSRTIETKTARVKP